MPKFAVASMAKLMECHRDLKLIAKRSIDIVDFSVLCGHRTEKEQNEAVEKGRSKLKYPLSKHNLFPAMAMDCVPYPLDWQDLDSFIFMAGHILAVAHILFHEGMITHKLKWLGFGKMADYPHFELVTKP